MAEMFRVRCPGCGSTLQIRRPTSETVQLRCGRCKKVFSARVSGHSTTAPPSGVPSSASDPFDSDALFSSGLESGPASSAPQTPAASPSYSLPMQPRYQATVGTRKPKKRFDGRVLLIGGLVAAASVGVAVLGIGAWFAFNHFSNGSLSRVALFADSPSAIAEDIVYVVEDFIGTLESIEGNDSYAGTIEALKEVETECHTLRKRIALLPPITDLQQEEAEQAIKNTAKYDPSEAPDVIEDLRRQRIASDDLKNAILDTQRSLASVTTYFAMGHAVLAEPTSAIDKIYHERVDTKRDLNRTLAGAKSQSDVDAAVEEARGIATRFNELAEERYQLGKSRGMPSAAVRQYQQQNGHIERAMTTFVQLLEADGKDVGALRDAMIELATAESKIEFAAMGIAPTEGAGRQ